MSQEEQMKEAMAEAVTTVEDPIEKMTAVCLSRGYNGILALGRLFRRSDGDGSFTLARSEMADLLTEFGLEFSEEESTELFDQFDTDASGTVNYEEFLDSIRPPMSDPRKEIVADAFNILDETGDEVVNIEDLRAKFCATQHPKVLSEEMTEDEVLERFLGRFDGNIAEDGKLTKAEFFDYYTGVSKSIDEDDYFVEMMKKVWDL